MDFGQKSGKGCFTAGEEVNGSRREPGGGKRDAAKFSYLGATYS